MKIYLAFPLFSLIIGYAAEGKGAITPTNHNQIQPNHTMKLSFNKYGSPCANGAAINVDTLASILECLGITHKLKSAPAEMRADDFKLASDYEAKANRKEIFSVMLNHKQELEPIQPLIECRISETGNAYEIVTGWSL